MKTNFLFLAILLSLASMCATAQTKKLRTNREDGFQWYETTSSDDMFCGAESVDGKTIIPLSCRFRWIIYHPVSGHRGYFEVNRGSDYYSCGVYDIYGREIIAPKYYWIYYSDRDSFEYADTLGYFHSLGITLDANGRASSYHLASKSSSSSSSSSGSGSSTLLYKGGYWICGDLGDIDGYIEIYTDCLVMNGKTTFNFKETRPNGDRLYENGSRLLVDQNYNIRRDGPIYCSFRKIGSGDYIQTFPQQQYQQPQYQQPTPTPQPQTQREAKDCQRCWGSGKCQTCNGRGYYTELGVGSGPLDCPNCNKTGRCSSCGGSGKQR